MNNIMVKKTWIMGKQIFVHYLMSSNQMCIEAYSCLTLFYYFYNIISNNMRPPSSSLKKTKSNLPQPEGDIEEYM